MCHVWQCCIGPGVGGGWVVKGNEPGHHIRVETLKTLKSSPEASDFTYMAQVRAKFEP